MLAVRKAVPEAMAGLLDGKLPVGKPSDKKQKTFRSLVNVLNKPQDIKGTAISKRLRNLAADREAGASAAAAPTKKVGRPPGSKKCQKAAAVAAAAAAAASAVLAAAAEAAPQQEQQQQ